MAQSASGPLVCPRCEAVLELVAASSRPLDTGVALDCLEPERESVPPLNFAEREQTYDRLRTIGRQLRSGYRHDTSYGLQPPPQNWQYANAQPVADAQLYSIRRTARREPSAPDKPTFASRTISFVLLVGTLGFLAGAGMLVWSVAFQLPEPWYWGLTTTLAAEGFLILGLVWMAGRLWHNSRRLNYHMEDFDRQLDEIERLTGSVAGSHMTSSQHYYNHFAQGASSQMLLANLRGQVDQLSSRLAG